MSARRAALLAWGIGAIAVPGLALESLEAPATNTRPSLAAATADGASSVRPAPSPAAPISRDAPTPGSTSKTLSLSRPAT